MFGDILARSSLFANVPLSDPWLKRFKFEIKRGSSFIYLENDPYTSINTFKSLILLNEWEKGLSHETLLS